MVEEEKLLREASVLATSEAVLLGTREISLGTEEYSA